MKQVLQRVWNYFLPSKQPKWKSIWNIESPVGKWEITIPDNMHEYLSKLQAFTKSGSNSYTPKDKIVLMYVPNDTYDKEIIRIECTFGDFEDLLKLIKQIT